MNSPHQMPNFFLIMAVGFVAIGLPLFLRYTGLRRSRAVLPWLATGLMAFVIAVYYGRAYPGPVRTENAVWVSFLILIGTAFGIRLYRKWLDGDLTEAERAGGTQGLRAWLSPANLLVAVAVAVCAWQGLGWPLLLMLVLTCGALVLWPALHANEATASMGAPTPVGREREKVLEMLESGKITVDESAELLHALGATTATVETPHAPMTGASRLVLCGAGLVLVGFLLPWFSFSPAAELSRTMEDFRAATGFLPPGFGPEVSSASSGRVFHVSGGDISHGLGWTVLVLALTSALLPYVVRTLERQTQRTLRWVALGSGGIVLLYLVSQNVRLVGAGLVIAIIGYGCEAIGLWQEQPRLTHPSVGGEVRLSQPYASGSDMPHHP